MRVKNDLEVCATILKEDTDLQYVFLGERHTSSYCDGPAKHVGKTK